MTAAPAMNGEAALVATGIAHAYGDVQALRGVDFAVQRGTLVALLGPNGGGKTTLLRILTTLTVPQGGVARVLGLDVVRQRAAVRRRIGVVFQSPALDLRLTVRENLRHHGHLYGRRGRDLEQRIATVFERFGLGVYSGARVATLSGGWRRRVELAKALLPEPEVLLLDEPTVGLDPTARQELWREFERIRERGTTVLLTSHLLDEVEACDRVAILDRGRIVVEGEPAKLCAALGGDIVRFEARDPARLASLLIERCGVQPVVTGDSVHVEGVSPELARRVLLEFQDEVRSVTWARPTLADVFAHAVDRLPADVEPAATAVRA